MLVYTIFSVPFGLFKVAISSFVNKPVSIAILFLFENVGALGRNRILKILGRYSLEIYVIHCLFTAGLRVLLPKIGIENLLVCFLLNVIISITIPILFAILCKKLHIHEILFKPATYLIKAKERVKHN